MSMENLPMLETEEAVAPRPKRSRSLWLSLSAVALVSVGVVGYTLRPKVSTVHHLQHMQNKIQTIAKRVLQGELGAKISVSSLNMEEGSDAPSAMHIGAKLRQEVVGETSRPAVIATFASKPGKNSDLLRQFKNVKRGLIEFEQSMSGDRSSEMLERAITIEEGDIDEVVIKVEAPDTPMEEAMNDEMSEAISEVAPTFEFHFRTGRSIGEMMQLPEMPIPLLPGGFEITAEAKLAEALSDVIEDEFGAMPATMMLRQVAKFDLRDETIYRKNSAEYLGMYPTLSNFEYDVRQSVQRIPASIRDALSGLDESAAGLKALKLVGLPDRFMVDFTFDNFHIAPALKDIISAVDDA